MSGGRRHNEVEWRTVALAVVIYGGWFAVVAGHSSIPWWTAMALLSVLLAWHGSLQHELVHGHPFGRRAANDALGSVPLSPRLPYQAYRRFHLQHHASADLTDPNDDVESYYITSQSWSRLPRVGRMFRVAHQTFAGRLILGPPYEIVTVWSWHFREIWRGDRQLARYWARHLALFALVSLFVLGVAGMPVWTYLGAIYLGHSLGLVRSFCEHRWAAGSASRSAVVRSGRFFSLLFLNNNLHHAHHARPGAAWYRLPALADELDSDQAAAAGAGLYDGYLQVARRHLFRPIDDVVHPAYRSVDSGRTGTVTATTP